VSIPRYAARTAAFAALHVLATLAGLWTAVGTTGVHLLWPAAVVGAIWLLAQSPFGRRDLDVIALSVVSVLVPVADKGMLGAFALATAQVVPALLAAWLVDRWLPGWWRGHGDRFRRTGPTLTRLGAAASIAAAAGAVLYAIVVPFDLSAAEACYVFVRDATAVLLALLAVRAARFIRRTPSSPTGPSKGLTIAR
jgi:hypothetical protein